ncbi:hypothetical protein WHR41_03764 [Cladosporium halotolerans]|uniref:Uncharacterized protein n=1 Tax=Cladosporium halotolerans TaxID=1052096 RepID=A0AB34KUD7_9PEZI
MIRTILRRTALAPHTTNSIRLSSSTSNSSSQKPPSQAKLEADERSAEQKSSSEPGSGKKTMAQMDEELRQKMSGLAGDGGEAGVEFEDGQPVSMKRSVKNNMFRYI